MTACKVVCVCSEGGDDVQGQAFQDSLLASGDEDARSRD